MPVSIKGDTIVYNADSFKSGTERKLEDVLKKLPGVEVNKDGEIEIEGKKVQKVSFIYQINWIFLGSYTRKDYICHQENDTMLV